MDERILNLLVELKEDQTAIVSRLGVMDSRLDKIDSRLDKIEKKLDSVVTETANLMEFRSDIIERVDSLQKKI